jgi:hypothetical protein
MKKDIVIEISLIGLVTILAVLRKNCNLSDSAVNWTMNNSEDFETIVKQELNMSDTDLLRLLTLCKKWEDGNNLDIFGFRLGE